MKSMLLLIFLLSVALTSPVLSEENEIHCYAITVADLTRKSAPRFDQYPSKREEFKNPKVNLKSNPIGRAYRTVLREGVAKGPNFSGHYTVVEWGCGTACFQFAIVDIRSGKIILPEDFSGVSGVDFEVEDIEKPGDGLFQGLRYRIDSRLLVVVGMLHGDKKEEGVFYYLLDGEKLKRVFTVFGKPRLCDD